MRPALWKRETRQAVRDMTGDAEQAQRSELPAPLEDYEDQPGPSSQPGNAQEQFEERPAPVRPLQSIAEGSPVLRFEDFPSGHEKREKSCL